MLTFDEVAKYATSHWGLTLYRCDPNSRGRWSACWKSGFGLFGRFPGEGHSHRRFKTIKAVAKAIGYKEPSP